MEKLERLEAEVEGLKIVCMTTCRHLGRFAWSEARQVAQLVATKRVDQLEAKPWTDSQLEHVKAVVSHCFGQELPGYEAPALPPLPPRRSRSRPCLPRRQRTA